MPVKSRMPIGISRVIPIAVPDDPALSMTRINRERRLRRAVAKTGRTLHKDRRRWLRDCRGERYCVVDLGSNVIVAWEASLDQLGREYAR